jgi:hypothetical protein
MRSGLNYVNPGKMDEGMNKMTRALYDMYPITKMSCFFLK